MNTKRIFFWIGFVVVLALIIWGLIAAMNKAPANQNPAGTPAPVTAADHIQGPVTAPVTLIEYSDFQCPACEAYYPLVTQVLASTTVPVRFVYRHFPLPQHANAIPAAVAAEAASVQGQFWGMYNLLFTNHADWTELSDPTSVFMGYASTLGFNTAQFKADLSSSTLRAIVQADNDEGISIGVDATPTFFVNGHAITNPQNNADFQALIQAAAGGSSH